MEKFRQSGHTPEINKGPRKLRNRSRLDSLECTCEVNEISRDRKQSDYQPED